MQATHIIGWHQESVAEGKSRTTSCWCRYIWWWTASIVGTGLLHSLLTTQRVTRHDLTWLDRPANQVEYWPWGVTWTCDMDMWRVTWTCDVDVWRVLWMCDVDMWRWHEDWPWQVMRQGWSTCICLWWQRDWRWAVVFSYLAIWGKLDFRPTPGELQPQYLHSNKH